MFQLKYVHLNIILNSIDPSNIAACGHAGLTRGMHTVALWERTATIMHMADIAFETCGCHLC